MPNILEIVKKAIKYKEDYETVISTVWKAKGREWDVVLLDEPISSSILSIVHGNFSTGNTECVRVLYVAATRAKKQLVFTSSLTS
jgi:superfamily I DNA/RNA helicase